MIDVGINLFTVKKDQEGWVRGESVFYLRGDVDAQARRYPADLYQIV